MAIQVAFALLRQVGGRSLIAALHYVDGELALNASNSFSCSDEAAALILPTSQLPAPDGMFHVRSLMHKLEEELAREFGPDENTICETQVDFWADDVYIDFEGYGRNCPSRCLKILQKPEYADLYAGLKSVPKNGRLRLERIDEWRGIPTYRINFKRYISEQYMAVRRFY